MQVNFYYPAEQKEKTSATVENRENQVEKNSFFAYALGKTQSAFLNRNFMNYGKDGLQREENSISKNQEMTQINSREDMLKYIQDNIDTLKDLMTDEDYSAMAELGLAPEKESPDTLVTVYERIQIQLAAFTDGENVSISGVSQDKIKKVLGSEAMAQSMKVAEQIGTLTEGAKEYLLRNELNPTIENVYKAVHSAQNFETRGHNRANWDSLEKQVTGILEKSGVTIEPESLESAKWLVQHDVPLTVENVLKLQELNQVDLKNQTEILQTNVAYALMFGMKGNEAFVTENWIEPSKAQEVLDSIRQVSDEVIYRIAKEGAVLNAANIQHYEENPIEYSEMDMQNPHFVRQKNVILQARVQLTAASMLAMQKLGMHIFYEDISNMVTQAKQMETEYYNSLSGTVSTFTMSQTERLASVMSIMESMNQVPSAVMAGIYQGETEFTIGSIYEKSRNYTKAEMTYEAVGTQVRADLGDSMQKAFENIDHILEEQDIAVNESSRRAARILGYNQMEINPESIRQMESLMTELDYTRDCLTPKTAVLLVEQDINIFHMDIRELNEKLEEINEMIGADANEDFAKYLWKLEKSHKISPENREKYIELYRTLHFVEQADGKSIGAVAAQGAEFTLANLLKAVKSANKKVDVRVDNSVGMQQEMEKQAVWTQRNENLTSFIRKMAGRIRSNLNAENVERIYKKGNFEELALGNLVDIVSENESVRMNEQQNAEYAARCMERYMKEAQTKGITEDAVLTLLESGQNASMEHVISAVEISTPNSEFRKYLLNKEKQEQVAKAAERILEEFEDEERANQAVDELKEKVQESMPLPVRRKISYEQARMAADLNRNVQFMANSAKNQTYHIPMELSGEAVTVRVSLVKKEGAGQAEVSLNTLAFGKVDALLQASHGEEGIVIKALVSCENAEMADLLIKNQSVFENQMQGLGKISLKIVQGTWKSQQGKNAGKTEEQRVQTGELYKISKSFLKSVKECLDENR